MTWPDAVLSEIQSREDLANYLTGLAADIREGKVVVENTSAQSLVDSAGRWAGAMDGFFANVVKEPVPENPDWAMVAAIFRAALVYE